MTQAIEQKTFKFFSDGVVKAFKGDDGLPRIRFTASSNTTDLDWQFFSDKALGQMAASAPGTTAFLNHDWQIPESVWGLIETAELLEVDDTDPMTGAAVKMLRLDFVMLLATENPRALNTFALIEKGQVKLGASVTCIVNKTIPTKDGREQLDDIHYLEVSAVGIPANPRSWVQQAMKAFKQNEVNKEMTTKQEAKKSLWEQSLAEISAAETIWDSCYALQDAISDLIESVEGGRVSDGEAQLKQLLNEWAAYVYTCVAPALAVSNDASGTNNGMTFLAFKPNAKMLTDLIPLVAKGGSRHNKSDLAMLQGIHDLCFNLGTKCMKDMDEEGMQPPADNGDDKEDADANKKSFAALETTHKTLQLELTSVQKELDTYKQESAQWKAAALLAKGMVERYLNEPMPRTASPVGN